MVKTICNFILYKLLGWRFEGTLPVEKKYLFVELPHTSNWDFIIGFLAIKAEAIDVKVFAKDSFYIFPLNYICDFLGIMPVNRKESTNFVDQVTQMYKEHDQLALLLTPEGTRGYRENLKSGYYYLAKSANVPIIVAGLDYKAKKLIVEPSRTVMSTFEEDQALLKTFARKLHAKKPENTFQ